MRDPRGSRCPRTRILKLDTRLRSRYTPGRPSGLAAEPYTTVCACVANLERERERGEGGRRRGVYIYKGACDREGALWALKSTSHGALFCSSEIWRRTAHRSPPVRFRGPTLQKSLDSRLPLDERRAERYGGDQRQENPWPGRAGTHGFYKSSYFCRCVELFSLFSSLSPR